MRWCSYNYKFGGGYVNNPVISFTNEIFKAGVTTASASAVSVVSAAGTITNIYLTNTGAGYSVAPTVSIAAPIAGANTGNFAFNEIVTGSTSNTLQELDPGMLIQMFLKLQVFLEVSLQEKL